MDQQQEMDARIRDAWKERNEGRFQEAIQKFLEVTSEAPDNIDAQWGLGLAYRGAQDAQSAVQAFQIVLDLISTQLQNESEQVERYVMLKRMADQQIKYMGEFLRR